MPHYPTEVLPDSKNQWRSNSRMCGGGEVAQEVEGVRHKSMLPSTA
jgi:hypothetical protein